MELTSILILVIKAFFITLGIIIAVPIALVVLRFLFGIVFIVFSLLYIKIMTKFKGLLK